MQYNEADIKNLYLQSFPKGRAFDFANTEYADKYFGAVAKVDSDYLQTSQDILDGLFTDSGNFTVEDARKLEKRYGIVINENNTLADRKMAIEDRLTFPNGIEARQSASYMEYRLRQAGFDVYVHENRFDDGSGGYETVIADTSLYDSSYYDAFYYDETGIAYTEIIRNYIDVSRESELEITYSNNWRFTFYIGGSTFQSFANVDSERKNEFRHLILKLKPCHLVGLLIVNYV